EAKLFQARKRRRTCCDATPPPPHKMHEPVNLRVAKLRCRLVCGFALHVASAFAMPSSRNWAPCSPHHVLKAAAHLSQRMPSTSGEADRRDRLRAPPRAERQWSCCARSGRKCLFACSGAASLLLHV